MGVEVYLLQPQRCANLFIVNGPYPQVLAVSDSLFSWSAFGAKNVLFLELGTWRAKITVLLMRRQWG